MTRAKKLKWEDVGWFSDCALAAVGDTRLLDDDAWVSHDEPYLRVRRSGYGMIYAMAQCDGLPVEIGRLGDNVVAARLEFVSGVDRLEASKKGRWKKMGRLRIGKDGALALDQFRGDYKRWCHRVPLAAGWYAAEVFKTKHDHLGIRLRAERQAS